MGIGIKDLAQVLTHVPPVNHGSRQATSCLSALAFCHRIGMVKLTFQDHREVWVRVHKWESQRLKGFVNCQEAGRSQPHTDSGACRWFNQRGNPGCQRFYSEGLSILSLSTGLWLKMGWSVGGSGVSFGDSIGGTRWEWVSLCLSCLGFVFLSSPVLCPRLSDQWGHSMPCATSFLLLVRTTIPENSCKSILQTEVPVTWEGS